MDEKITVNIVGLSEEELDELFTKMAMLDESIDFDTNPKGKKRCRVCGRIIPNTATVCRYCGYTQ